MKKLLGLVPLSIILSGCAVTAYQTGPVPGGYPPPRPMYPQPAPFQPGPSPIGRWDNVMMLAPASRVQVLMADGTIATGPVVGASTTSLRLSVASGDLDLPVADVMRVDRLKAPASGVRDGAVGAAWGVGVVALTSLVLRRMPPPQWVAAGAIVGANEGVQIGRMGPDLLTIYVSPAVASGGRPRIQ